MPSLNEVKLIGNLGEDPELRDANGTDVCTVTIATNEYRGKGDQREQFTEWHRVVLWGQHARYASQYLHKGDTVFVDGRLKTRKWQDNEGHDQYTTEVVAEDFQGFNRGRSEGQGAGNSNHPPADSDNNSNAGRSRGRRQQ